MQLRCRRAEGGDAPSSTASGPERDQIRRASLAKRTDATWRRIPSLSDLPHALEWRRVSRRQGGIWGIADDARRVRPSGVVLMREKVTNGTDLRMRCGRER